MNCPRDWFPCAQSIHEDIVRRTAERERNRIVAQLRRVLDTWDPECVGCDAFEAFETAIDDVEAGDR